MSRTARYLLVAAGIIIVVGNAHATGVTVLTYHDVVTNPAGDRYAVSVQKFRNQLEFLKANGYQPISLSYFIKARRGAVQLPDRAVMLTFDDGLISYRDNVVPMLQQYGYPSVLSVVTGWVDGQHQPDEYRGKLLNWNQLRQLQKSPLVEIVSHSHNLHHWITSSPLESQAPAGVTHRYDTRAKAYESEQAFESRIRSDLLITRKRFRQMLGHVPLALTWPYGEYDKVTLGIARSVGFEYQFTLDEGLASYTELPDIRRYIVLREHTMQNFQSMFVSALNVNTEQRFVEFNLDVFAHVSPEYHNRLMTQLVDRIGSLAVNTVIVTPFTADHLETFFPNNSLPMKYDLLNGILDRLRSQYRIENVYLRIPETGKSLPISFFDNLARNIRFNAIVFDKAPDNDSAARIRKALSRYLPKVLLGAWDAKTDRLDISIVKAGAGLSVRDAKHRLLVYVNQDNYLTTTGLSDALRSLRSSGIRNYGYSSLNYMAGAQAPDEIVEAMARNLPGTGH